MVFQRVAAGKECVRASLRSTGGQAAANIYQVTRKREVVSGATALDYSLLWFRVCVLRYSINMRKEKKPEIGIPPSDRDTRRYTKSTP